MRIRIGLVATTTSLIFAFGCEPTLSDGKVADVFRADRQVLIRRGEDEDEVPMIVEEGTDEAEKIFLDELLTAGTPPGSSVDRIYGLLHMKLDDHGETTLKVVNGSIEFKKDKTGEKTICEVKGIASFKTVGNKNETILKTCDVEAGGFYWRHLATEFMIDARGEETSLFVIEGSVEVSSTDPEYKEDKKVVVNAGEWLMTRRGKSIPPPMRYRRTDAVSGNSECIYSWCTLTRDVLEPPSPPPLALPPPSPNPPGQR